MTRLLVVVLLLGYVMSQSDVGRLPTVIETGSLPLMPDNLTIDSRRMPSIGNGHLATVLYNDTVYMNGLYNGQSGASHRARIPAEINVRVDLPQWTTGSIYRHYKLDMKNGYWEENITVSTCRVTQRVYAHQYYTRLLVTEITAQRQGTATGNILLNLNITRGGESSDIKFPRRHSFNGGNWRTTGTTMQSEVPGGHKSKVHMFWTLVPPVIHIPSHMNSIRHTFIMSVDMDEQVARESFESGTWIADKNPDHFFSMHRDSWSEKWAEGKVELFGDPYLEKLSYSSFYYLLSSLPSVNSHRKSNPFGGVSPEGLARGGKSSVFSGHVTTEQETSILPAILPFHPSLARSLLNFRVNTRPAADANAKKYGYEGLMYPWESAATGYDVSKCPKCTNDRVHVSGEVAFAARQYVSMTRDKRWLQEKGGCELIRDIAKFWYSRIERNKRNNRYDIIGVTSSDESNGRVDNSVYTNAIASLAMHFAMYGACMCNQDVNTFAPLEWIQAAERIHWEFNNTGQMHPQYHQYTRKDGMRRAVHADVIKLGFPLMWDMSQAVRETDLTYYYSTTSDRTPAVTQSLYTIGWLEVGQTRRAREQFKNSYQPYITEPFKVWTEYPGDLDSTNHMPGHAAYIQTLLYGYGGLRIHTEYLSMNPQLPDSIASMTFIDIDYLGAKLDIRVTDRTVDILVKRIGIYPLVLTVLDTGQISHLIKDARIPIARGGFTISPKSGSGCPLPGDNILPFEGKSITAAHNHASLNESVSRTLILVLSIFLLIPQQ